EPAHHPYPVYFAIGDFIAADGLQDFAMCWAHRIRVYRSKPAITFQFELTTPKVVLGTATGDFDGDGRDDFAVLCDDLIWVLLHGQSMLPVPLPEDDWVGLVAGKFTGSAHDDLVAIGEHQLALRGRGCRAALASARFPTHHDVEHPMPAA